jgi:hypothetical protein
MLNTDIEELENEEETIHTSGGGKFPSSNTEEPEFEESTTVQHKTMQKTQYMSPQIINSASQSNYGFCFTLGMLLLMFCDSTVAVLVSEPPTVTCFLTCMLSCEAVASSAVA